MFESYEELVNDIVNLNMIYRFLKKCWEKCILRNIISEMRFRYG